MDTGLNNKNTLHSALENEDFRDVEWLVEATSSEQQTLWEDWNEQFDWESKSRMYSYTIVELEITGGIGRDSQVLKEKLPVVIDFAFALINGHRVAFYNCCSRLVHHGYVEAFLKTYFQRTHDGYTRWNHTDAGNFHNCVNYLDTIDTWARDTTYKPDTVGYHIFKPANDQE